MKLFIGIGAVINALINAFFNLPYDIYVIAKYCADNNTYYWDLSDDDWDEIIKELE